MDIGKFDGFELVGLLVVGCWVMVVVVVCSVMCDSLLLMVNCGYSGLLVDVGV